MLAMDDVILLPLLEVVVGVDIELLTCQVVHAIRLVLVILVKVGRVLLQIGSQIGEEHDALRRHVSLRFFLIRNLKLLHFLELVEKLLRDLHIRIENESLRHFSLNRSALHLGGMRVLLAILDVSGEHL